MKVGSLYDRTNGRWNEGLIRDLAIPNDVAQILKIQLPIHQAPNQLIIPYTDDGRVSVRTTYHSTKGDVNREDV